MWASRSATDGWSEPALGPDGTIYVSVGPYLQALDPNGRMKWSSSVRSASGFTLAVGNNGLIYAASYDGYLYVVNPDGKEIARLQSNGWPNFPVIAADNTVIVNDAEDYSMLITDATNTVWAITRYGCEDLNADEMVNLVDLALLAADWLECTDRDWPCSYVGQEQYLTGDINRDQYVRFSDLAAIADRWLDDVGWLKPPPCLASNPNPANGAAGVAPAFLLWTPCPDALWHDVYFGTDWSVVANDTPTGWWGAFRGRQPRWHTSYFLFFPDLEWGKTYYWRIDEVSDTVTITNGTVWSFTTRTEQ